MVESSATAKSNFTVNYELLLTKHYSKLPGYLKTASNGIMDSMALIVGTAIKNLELAKFLKQSDSLGKIMRCFDDVSVMTPFKGKTEEETKKNSESYEKKVKIVLILWVYASLWRDAAKNIFHGSVVTDLVDNAVNIKTFVEIGIKICTMLGVKD